ncbi:MAG: hypothetical protein PHI97_33180 [Desulfobulbus sp.]|nr:hypothetical protein [Desulfobulbus sp.]
MKIFHQAGHNTIWNISSFQDGIGDGVIFSPVHYAERNIATVDDGVRQGSLFDPQFYMPESQKSKLHSYDFFPDKIMNGFKTVDFCNVAQMSARLCLEYQERSGFSALIIPCRYHQDMITDFIDQQVKFTVDAFLAELPSYRGEKLVFLSLPLSIAMVRDQKYRTEILNWVTSYPEIDGVYLQVNFEERTKQVHDYDKLQAYANFVRELVGSELKVICGYSNLEGLLISLFDVWGVTIGAYENTRKFSTDKFIDDDKIQMGPAPRIYLPGLLNWVRYDTAKEIMEDCPDIWAKVYISTPEADKVLSEAKPPHFSQAPLYKHYFRLAYHEYQNMLRLTPANRHAALTDRVGVALKLHEEIESEGVQFFDENCRGGHLIGWRRLLKNLRGTF